MEQKDLEKSIDVLFDKYDKLKSEVMTIRLEIERDKAAGSQDMKYLKDAIKNIEDKVVTGHKELETKVSLAQKDLVAASSLINERVHELEVQALKDDKELSRHTEKLKDSCLKESREYTNRMIAFLSVAIAVVSGIIGVVLNLLKTIN